MICTYLIMSGGSTQVSGLFKPFENSFRGVPWKFCLGFRVDGMQVCACSGYTGICRALGSLGGTRQTHSLLVRDEPKAETEFRMKWKLGLLFGHVLGPRASHSQPLETLLGTQLKS